MRSLQPDPNVDEETRASFRDMAPEKREEMLGQAVARLWPRLVAGETVTSCDATEKRIFGVILSARRICYSRSALPKFKLLAFSETARFT